MLGPNHELSGFAVVTTWAAASGVPPIGCLVLGALGAHTCDWPDIDHEGATITTMLKWIPYWTETKRNKDGTIRRSKPTGKGWGPFKDTKGRPMVKRYYFPSWQVHRFMCRLSECIYDRWATPADKRDSTRKFGPSFRVHRGFAHSVWCALITGCIWFGIFAALGAWRPGMWPALHPLLGTDGAPLLLAETMALGMISHIGGDGCTDFGVSPWAPVIRWPERNTVGPAEIPWFPKAWAGRRYPRMGLWEPMRFKVNHGVEKVIIAPTLGVCAALSVIGAFISPGVVATVLGRAVTRLWVAFAGA